jgi:hypothetical protein
MMHSRIKYQKATEAPTTTIITPKDAASPGSLQVNDGRTIAMMSPYLVSGETPPSERKKRTPRKPPASAA